VFGLLVGRVLLVLHSAELKDEPRVLVAIDRLSPRGGVTAALIACGASLIAGRFGGLYGLAGAHVGALLAGLFNAWVFLLVAGAHKAPPTRRPDAPSGRRDRRARHARHQVAPHCRDVARASAGGAEVRRFPSTGAWRGPRSSGSPGEINGYDAATRARR
jgi:hypothetical protein